LSTIFGSLFDDTGATPAQLRTRLLGDRELAMPRLVARAVDRGEISTTPPDRVVNLPFDLYRHELIMNLVTVPAETSVDIVYTVFLPLVTGPTVAASQ